MDIDIQSYVDFKGFFLFFYSSTFSFEKYLVYREVSGEQDLGFWILFLIKKEQNKTKKTKRNLKKSLGFCSPKGQGRN